MATWLQPLELQTIFMNIFAGNQDYFIAISLLVISGMAGYFRMTSLTMFFMLGLFIFMFSEFIAAAPILTFFAIIAGLVIGYVISRIWDR